jgi:hypothetical protein
MPTFTDENSALGDQNNRVKIPCCLPAIFGILISLGAYLFARDASGYGLWLPGVLLFGIILTTLCYWSEKEGQMLNDPCLSSTAAESIKPNLTLWLRMQGIYLISVATIFGVLSVIGDPVFAMYLDLKGTFLNP